jgi:hypothetical protein
MFLKNITIESLYLQLKENEVRMKNAATLLLGPHNELRSLVEENTAEWIDGPPAAPVDHPINLSDWESIVVVKCSYFLVSLLPMSMLPPSFDFLVITQEFN